MTTRLVTKPCKVCDQPREMTAQQKICGPCAAVIKPGRDDRTKVYTKGGITDRASALALYQTGLTDSRIAKLMGVSNTWVQKWRAAEGLPAYGRAYTKPD